MNRREVHHDCLIELGCRRRPHGPVRTPSRSGDMRLAPAGAAADWSAGRRGRPRAGDARQSLRWLSIFPAGQQHHAWLHRILVNTHISNCRKNQRRPAPHLAQHITDSQSLVNAAHSATGLPSAEDQALQRFGDQDVRAAMHTLPEQFRTAVYYADIEGLRCKEIAAVMNTPVGTVVSRLHRGRRRLRRLLAESGGREDLALTAEGLALKKFARSVQRDSRNVITARTRR